MPFAGFKDFDDCVSKHMAKKSSRTGKNYTKKEASAVCATIKRKVEGESLDDRIELTEKHIKLKSDCWENAGDGILRHTDLYIFDKERHGMPGVIEFMRNKGMI